MGSRISSLETSKAGHKDKGQIPEESEVKYLTLVQNVRDGVVIVQDGVYQFANDGMAEISGYAVEEIIGMRVLHMIAPE